MSEEVLPYGMWRYVSSLYPTATMRKFHQGRGQGSIKKTKKAVSMNQFQCGTLICLNKLGEMFDGVNRQSKVKV